MTSLSLVFIVWTTLLSQTRGITFTCVLFILLLSFVTFTWTIDKPMSKSLSLCFLSHAHKYTHLWTSIFMKTFFCDSYTVVLTVNQMPTERERESRHTARSINLTGEQIWSHSITASRAGLQGSLTPLFKRTVCTLSLKRPELKCSRCSSASCAASRCCVSRNLAVSSLFFGWPAAPVLRSAFRSHFFTI